jgi:hypothetical protein
MPSSLVAFLKKRRMVVGVEGVEGGVGRAASSPASVFTRRAGGRALGLLLLLPPVPEEGY